MMATSQQVMTKKRNGLVLQKWHILLINPPVSIFANSDNNIYLQILCKASQTVSHGLFSATGSSFLCNHMHRLPLRVLQIFNITIPANSHALGVSLTPAG